MDNIGEYNKIGEFDLLFVIGKDIPTKEVNANNLIQKTDYKKFLLADGFADIAKVTKNKRNELFFHVKADANLENLTKHMKNTTKILDYFETNVLKLKQGYIVKSGKVYNFKLKHF